MAVTLPGQMPYKSSGMASEWDAALNAAVRKKKLAEMLQQQALSPLDDVASRTPGAKMSFLQPLGKMAMMLAGQYAGKGADEEESAANKLRQAKYEELLNAYPEGTPGAPEVPAEPGMPAIPAQSGAFGPTSVPRGVADSMGPPDPSAPPPEQTLSSPLAQSLMKPPPGAPPPGLGGLAASLMPPLLPQQTPGQAPAPPPPSEPLLLPQRGAIDAIAGKPAVPAVAAKPPTPQELLKYGAQFAEFGPAAADIGKQITSGAIKGLTPMSPAETAELAAKQEDKKAALLQKAEDARQRSQDMRYSVDERERANRESIQARKEIAQLVHSGKAGDGSPTFTHGPEGTSRDGNPVLRDKHGVQHEVIGGVPSKNPYDGPVTPLLDQRKGVEKASKGAQSVADMQSLYDKIDADPDTYGTMGTLGQLTPNLFGAPVAVSGFNEDQLSTRAQAAAMTADTKHSLYGSALTPSEQKEANRHLIDPKDTPIQVKAKLKARMELEQRHFDNLDQSAKNAYYARTGKTPPGKGGSGSWDVQEVKK